MWVALYNSPLSEGTSHVSVNLVKVPCDNAREVILGKAI